jgi:hypothetical protein
MNKRVMKTIMGSLVATAMAFGMSGTALADGDSVVCGPQTLHGSYVFNPHGFSIVDGAAQPIAVFEGIDFNGDGTLTVPFATVSINGLILQFPPGGTGSYTLDSNCQGTLTFDLGPINYNIFVRSNGREIWMIETNANSVLNGMAEKVPR